MKKHFPYGALLAAALCPSLSCSSISLKATDTRPITKQPRVTTQAVLTALPTTPRKRHNPFIRLLKQYKGKLSALMGLLWLWFLARFYTNEKRRRIPGWSFDDLARLKLIKDSATRLWHHHHPYRKIIRLEDWRG
jgi:hypothetical protein